MTLEDYISFVGYPDYEMFFDRIQELRVTDDGDLSDSVLVDEADYYECLQNEIACVEHVMYLDKGSSADDRIDMFSITVYAGDS